VPKSGSLDPFQTKDGWVTIAPFTDQQWERLCAGVGHPEWWQLESRADRMRAALRGIAKAFPEQESAHWLAILKEADCPGGAVHNYDTLFEEPEVVANENFTIYEHPQAGQVRTVNSGMRFSETPARMRRMPPRLGEHTEEVLREAGFERSQIEELRSEKVIN
jgi:crotonobetainyl-CoA:carnitine CoA-transferase CaiB-like acyl-CoA transferase